MVEQKKIIIYHPFGNANVRAAIKGLYLQGLLYSFHTCIACFKGSMLYRLSSWKVFREFRRREFDVALRNVTFMHPWKEVGRHAAMKLNLSFLTAHETGKFCVDSVCHDLDKKVARYLALHNNAVAGVYTYEDMALDTFSFAKKKRIKCLYDLPTGYWRAKIDYLHEEKVKNPQWAITITGLHDSEKKLQCKDKELALADKIYVASSFTRRTLEMYPGQLAPIEVIPYGFPPVNGGRVYTNCKGRKIKVLFVGGLSQQKGISYFFEALQGLESCIEATVVGRGMLEECPALKEALANVHYIPSLPHRDVLQLMATQDLFIFPSLFDGFGLVITEAMSQGTPVITTDRTCGPDIITHGVDGWIVKTGDAAPIKALLEDFVKNPEKLAVAGQNARVTASRRPWSVYEKELAKSVNIFLNDKLSQPK